MASMAAFPAPVGRGLRRLLPGIVLCVVVSLLAHAVEGAEVGLFGHPWVESLVLAILIGTALRSTWSPPAAFGPGIAFCAKPVLEVAVLLLGASVSLQTVAAAGWGLLVGIALIVAVAVAASYGLGRLFGLTGKMALLVAAGNSICGNSAIAAVAPVIGASSKDVASSIAFTAVLGVAVVLLLPLSVPLLGLSALQYGAVAGLTVYAVPQVLAAAAPIGPVAVQTGTLVKLVRVLMLGPLVLILSLGAARRAGAGRLRFGQAVPWFIMGFLVLAGLRSAGLLPAAALPVLAGVSGALTVAAMAALGLGVDVRTVARAGGAVIATVCLSLALLLALSLGLARLLLA